MDQSVIVSFLQLFAGVVLFAATAMAGWALKEVFRLRADVEALKARVAAERDAVADRFENLTGWMKSITEKLDRVVERGSG